MFKIIHTILYINDAKLHNSILSKITILVFVIHNEGYDTLESLLESLFYYA